MSDFRVKRVDKEYLDNLQKTLYNFKKDLGKKNIKLCDEPKLEYPIGSVEIDLRHHPGKYSRLTLDSRFVDGDILLEANPYELILGKKDRLELEPGMEFISGRGWYSLGDKSRVYCFISGDSKPKKIRVTDKFCYDTLSRNQIFGRVKKKKGERFDRKSREEIKTTLELFNIGVEHIDGKFLVSKNKTTKESIDFPFVF